MRTNRRGEHMSEAEFAAKVTCGEIRLARETELVIGGGLPPPAPATGNLIAHSPAPKRKPSHEEDQLQIAFVSWCLVMESLQWPDLSLAFHPANGGKRAFKTDVKGNRYSPEAQRLKKMGVREGVPDWILPAARGSYRGLAIEFKSADGVVRPAQKKYCDKLERQGWMVLRACRSLDLAQKTVTDYFQLPWTG